MRVAIAGVLLSTVAAAEPGREVELMPVVGAALTLPSSDVDLAAIERTPKTPIGGMAIAWERDPFANPCRQLGFRWALGEWSLAPEVALIAEPRRTMWLAGVRLETTAAWEPTRPDRAPIMRDWITPHAGIVGDTAAIGLDYVSQLQLGRSWGIALRLGADYWRQTGSSIEPRGGAAPAARAYWLARLTAGIALTMRL